MNSQHYLDLHFQSRHPHIISESMNNDLQMLRMHPVTCRLSSPGLGPGPVGARPSDSSSPACAPQRGASP